MVLKLDPNTPNASCNVGIAHYLLGDDALAASSSTPATRKIPIPHAWVVRNRSAEGVLCATAEKEWGERSTSRTRAVESFQATRLSQIRASLEGALVYGRTPIRANNSMPHLSELTQLPTRRSLCPFNGTNF